MDLDVFESALAVVDLDHGVERAERCGHAGDAVGTSS